VQNLRRLCRELIILRLRASSLARITLDFDGSVFSTKRYAENSAVGYNKKHKGWRSYFPLFCTIAQTGQVFDLFHRPGNVYNSHDAQAFIASYVDEMRLALPGVIIEVRMDSAFFSKNIVSMLINRSIHFTISVPFERLVELKRKIESRWRWTACGVNTAFFEETWKPNLACRFLFVRTREAVQSREPIQLDLFIPLVFGYAHKVIPTNKTTRAAQIIDFHNGRGSQENILAELKTDANMAYIPFNRLVPNQTYLLSAVLAHNLSRKLQMATSDKQRNTTFKRIQLWPFHHIGTIRRNIINRACRRSQPHRQRRSENRTNLHRRQRNLDNRRLTPVYVLPYFYATLGYFKEKSLGFRKRR
jgi:hypothetical protein